MSRRWLVAVVAFLAIAVWNACSDDVFAKGPVVRAGAAKVDITPQSLPAICNGGFQKRLVKVIDDPLYARACVLSRNDCTVAFAVVDNCMIPQELCDLVKAKVTAKTGIPTDHICISATHCHSAPGLMPIFSSPVDESYAKFVPDKIAEAIILAYGRLQPAKIGSGFAFDGKNVFCRRYVMREGTAFSLPPAFTGCEKNLAQMGPGTKGRMNGNALYPTSIPDPTVSVLAAVSLDGKPIVLLGNYSTHYAGARGISSDYFGVFCKKIGEYIGAPDDFVALMCNGACGDCNCVNPDDPERKYTKETVGESVAQAAFKAWKTIKFSDDVPLAMREETMTLVIRKPSADDVAQAHAYLKEHADKPQTTEYVFAGETIGIDKMSPTRSFKVQTIRIGDLGIAAVPVQPYAWTGLQIRQNSPFAQTFTICLANGSAGYIPTDRDFELGGYTTWRVRTNCLAKGSEVKIRLKILDMLKQLAEAK
ncbi:MAG: hypothetical protein PHQ75_07235 [Thermoguttaceae bacterium]|nr:hypothetical protein [Thermoguttaceae bacterium]